MQTFREQREQQTQGMLTIFDRVVFKGHRKSFYPKDAFAQFLRRQNSLLKDYSAYAQQVTERRKAHAEGLAAASGRPYLFLQSGTVSKEAVAKQIADQDQISQGLVCVLAAVEPCWSFTVRGNASTQRKEVIYEQRKCTHYYFYYLDEAFGWMHVRLQSWFPFPIQRYVSGHEWVARRLSKQGIAHQSYDNTFTSVADLAAAQAACDKFAQRKWAPTLAAFAQRHQPLLPELQAAGIADYDWVVEQSEIASDLMFTAKASLDALVPALFQTSLSTFAAQDGMRFLGKKRNGHCQGEVVPRLQQRPEGWRVKHAVKTNSLTMYNKFSVLRIETTINNSRVFRMPAENSRRWKPCNKSVSNFWRLFQLGREINQRDLEALDHVSVQDREALHALDRLCRSQTTPTGQRIANFQPVTHTDANRFAAVLAAQHLLQGFRNAALCAALFPDPPLSPQVVKRRCAAVSRLIAKLRGHGLVDRVGNPRLYRATAYGFQVMAAALRFRHSAFPQAFSPA